MQQMPPSLSTNAPLHAMCFDGEILGKCTDMRARPDVLHKLTYIIAFDITAHGHKDAPLKNQFFGLGVFCYIGR